MKILCLLTSILIGIPAFSFAEFEWTDTEGKHVDLKFGSRPIARYVYENIDESSPERREETYKPFCHIYRKSGDKFLTKGPGGKFTHHRGIYYGFNKISYTDSEGNVHKNIDTWHCRQAHQIHRKMREQTADAKQASFTAEIDWIDNAGDAFAKEIRTMRFSLEGNDIVVDFTSKLNSLVPGIQLDGDPQHAGFQFRSHNDVSEKSAKQTYYIRPGSGAAKPGATINWSAKNDTEATRNLPWKGMCITLDEKVYTIAYLDSPENPKPARFSERDYGRFGNYFVSTVKPDQPLSVKYRLVIRQGEMTPDEIEAFSKAFTK